MGNWRISWYQEGSVSSERWTYDRPKHWSHYSEADTTGWRTFTPCKSYQLAGYRQWQCSFGSGVTEKNQQEKESNFHREWRLSGCSIDANSPTVGQYGNASRRCRDSYEKRPADRTWQPSNQTVVFRAISTGTVHHDLHLHLRVLLEVPQEPEVSRAAHKEVQSATSARERNLSEKYDKLFRDWRAEE